MVRSNFFRPKYLSPPNAKLFPRIFSVTEESLRRITLSGILGMIGMTFGPLAPILGHLDHLHQFPEGQMAESPARSNQLTSWIHIFSGIVSIHGSHCWKVKDPPRNPNNKRICTIKTWVNSQNFWFRRMRWRWILKCWRHWAGRIKMGWVFPNRRALTDFI